MDKKLTPTAAITGYLEVTPHASGLKTEQDGPPHRMLLAAKHVLWFNDGDEGEAELQLINGQALKIHETLEEVAGQLGVRLLKPKPNKEAKSKLKLVEN